MNRVGLCPSLHSYLPLSIKHLSVGVDASEVDGSVAVKGADYVRVWSRAGASVCLPLKGVSVAGTVVFVKDRMHSLILNVDDSSNCSLDKSSVLRTLDCILFKERSHGWSESYQQIESILGRKVLLCGNLRRLYRGEDGSFVRELVISSMTLLSQLQEAHFWCDMVRVHEEIVNRPWDPAVEAVLGPLVAAPPVAAPPAAAGSDANQQEQRNDQLDQIDQNDENDDEGELTAPQDPAETAQPAQAQRLDPPSLLQSGSESAENRANASGGGNTRRRLGRRCSCPDPHPASIHSMLIRTQSFPPWYCSCSLSPLPDANLDPQVTRARPHHILSAAPLLKVAAKEDCC